MAQPTFSIIIPARNMERFISDTLDSVSAQTFRAFEVICIDDGSTDSTRSLIDGVAQRDTRFNVVDGPAEGVSAARNLGLTQANAPFVLFLDADDMLHPEALSSFHETLRQSDCVGAVAGVQRVDTNGEPMRGTDNRSLVPADHQLDGLLRKNFVINGGAPIPGHRPAR